MARLIQVIETDDRRGLGKDGDPVRLVRQYWSPDGVLLCERDEWAFAVLADLSRKLSSATDDTSAREIHDWEYEMRRMVAKLVRC